jgi:CRP-like cAMP-binding protein
MVEDPRHRWIALHMGVGATTPLSADDAAALVDIMTVRKAKAGEALFCRNDDLQQIFVLESGTVALARPNADRTAFLNLLGPGDVFGDVGQLTGKSAPVDAVVLEDATALSMDGEALLALMMTRPRVAMRWMASLAARLEVAQDRLEELLAGPLDYQLASMLLHLCDNEGVVSVSQQTIAQLLGSRRPSIARSLANLERRGFIEKQYRRIQVLDEPALRALVSA